MNQKLIITADDYGLCNSVNEAIEECLGAGALRATCVMVNMPDHVRASSLRQKFPQASIGIHWNLTQGRPLLSPMEIPSLVKNDGNFQSALLLRRRWLTGKIKLSEIRLELAAQYQRFCKLLGPPDFWNTHQNFHVLPGLFRACVAIGQEHGIMAMRCHRRLTVSRDGTRRSFYLRHPIVWLKGQVIAFWSDSAKAQGISMPDGRLHMPGYRAGEAAIEEIMSRVSWDNVRTAVEMVTHPANAIDKELFGGLTESRVVEYMALRDPALVQRLRRAGVEIVGFEALREGLSPQPRACSL